MKYKTIIFILLLCFASIFIMSSAQDVQPAITVTNVMADFLDIDIYSILGSLAPFDKLNIEALQMHAVFGIELNEPQEIVEFEFPNKLNPNYVLLNIFLYETEDADEIRFEFGIPMKNGHERVDLSYLPCKTKILMFVLTADEIELYGG